MPNNVGEETQSELDAKPGAPIPVEETVTETVTETETVPVDAPAEDEAEAQPEVPVVPGTETAPVEEAEVVE